MVPIFEQGGGRSIGYGLDKFLRRFETICNEHKSQGRASSFAFIFYDFTDQPTRNLLEDLGVFAKLDRLSRNYLSIFYLHTKKREVVDKFNKKFLNMLDVYDKATLPCVVFFRVNDGSIYDIEIAQLENTDLAHGFNELYESIRLYVLNKQTPSNEQSRAIRWVKSGSKTLLNELFRAVLKKGLDLMI